MEPVTITNENNLPNKTENNIHIIKKNVYDENHDKLIKLKELFDKGVITEEEYNKKRKEYVDKL